MAIAINGDGTITGISVGGLPDGVVDAGTLATNSVDSAELVSGGVDNAHLATGVDAGKLINALPAISGASLTGMSSGAWELLQVVNITTGTASAELNTGMSTTYRRYKIYFQALTPSSGVWLYMQGRKAGTYVTSGYSYASHTHHTGNTVNTVSAGSTGQVAFGGYTLHGGNQRVHGEIDFADLYSDGYYRGSYRLTGRKSTSGYETFYSVGGFGMETGGTWDGLKLYFSSGDIYPTSRFFLLGLKGS